MSLACPSVVGVGGRGREGVGCRNPSFVAVGLEDVSAVSMSEGTKARGQEGLPRDGSEYLLTTLSQVHLRDIHPSIQCLFMRVCRALSLCQEPRAHGEQDSTGE